MAAQTTLEPTNREKQQNCHHTIPLRSATLAISQSFILILLVLVGSSGRFESLIMIETQFHNKVDLPHTSQSYLSFLSHLPPEPTASDKKPLISSTYFSKRSRRIL